VRGHGTVTAVKRRKLVYAFELLCVKSRYANKLSIRIFGFPNFKSIFVQINLYLQYTRTLSSITSLHPMHTQPVCESAQRPTPLADRHSPGLRYVGWSNSCASARYVSHARRGQTKWRVDRMRRWGGCGSCVNGMSDVSYGTDRSGNDSKKLRDPPAQCTH